MGIKNLNTFITKKAPEGIKDTEISEIEGQKLAIDTSIFLYKFMYSLKFIDSFIQQIYHFRKFNITPIYVFDGAPPKEKQETLNSRKEQKDKLCQNIEKIQLEIKEKRKLKEDFKDLQKELFRLKKKCIVITRDDIMNLKNVFNILGVEYIQADCEADLVCCELYKKKIVDACLSNDMDFLPSGCKKLIRNYNLSNNITIYDLDIILDKLDINYNQFVDFCILCGCDYTGKIPRLGSETAYKFIKQYNTIEEILDKNCGEGKKYVMPNNFEFQKSRKLLKNESADVSIKIINGDSRKKLSEIKPTQISYIQSMTKYTQKQLDNKLKVICII